MRALDNQKHRPRCEYWQELILQQEQSGLTVHAFCEQRGVTEASFYGWRKQLRGEAPVGFALVEAKESGLTPKAPVELVLATGERVQISPGTDAATLRMVLGVLRERA
jgi:transposase-like protein